MTVSTLGAATEYTYVVLPAISSATQSGSVAGNTLTITGTGFSTTKSDIKVSVDDVSCSVTSSSNN
jgi:hypothetical protein